MKGIRGDGKAAREMGCAEPAPTLRPLCAPGPFPRLSPALLLSPAGILFSVTILGPGVAFMLGSAMLRFYVDIDKVGTGEGVGTGGASGPGGAPASCGYPEHPCPHPEWLLGHPGDSSEPGKNAM